VSTDSASRLPVDGLRVATLGGTALVLASFVSVLYHVVDVVGNPRLLLLIVVGSLLAATVLSRLVDVAAATLVAIGLLTVGMAWYLTLLPAQALAFVEHAKYVLALLAGHSVLEIVNLKAWVLAITPAPVFLTWYLALRRRYVATAVIGGGTVGFFVLTGDASLDVALVGTVGTLALLGLGALERADATLGDADVMAMMLTAVVVVSLVVSVVPAGATFSYSPETGLASDVDLGGESSNTLEGSLLAADEQFRVQGSIELSPKLRYTVTSDVGAYWRVSAYDTYTGDGWIRRTSVRPDNALYSPAGRTRQIQQQFRAESQIATMPAAWRPVDVRGGRGADALVTGFGGLQPSRPLQAGDTYNVTSAVVVATAQQLEGAGTDYPDRIEQRYLQLPDSVPDRVGQRTTRLTANAQNPYQTARVVEFWLEQNRNYSLAVDRPDGNVADAFLFEMDRGYCVYYASTMAVMLRTQDIPARMVVGYTPGQRIDQNQWAVRGYNSHAWVEVYFPDVGWVRFDPTPAGPRVDNEQRRLEQARAANEANVDTDASRGPEWTPTTPGEPAETTTTQPTQATVTTRQAQSDAGPDRRNLPPGGETGGADGGVVGPLEPPSREGALLWAIALVGLVAGARRTGVTGRVYRTVWLRWQPEADPATDVERAFERLEYVLAMDHRPRRPAETPREYLDAIGADRRARRVATIREQALYADEVDRERADEAVALVDDLVGERAVLADIRANGR
jgi:transglutaminase-like putative cysteine protease